MKHYPFVGRFLSGDLRKSEVWKSEQNARSGATAGKLYVTPFCKFYLEMHSRQTGFACNLEKEFSFMVSLDWSQCSAVDSIPGKVSGAELHCDPKAEI